MAVDVDGIIDEWAKARSLGTRISNLARSAKSAYIDAAGDDVPPDATTISAIKAEAALLVPEFEAALVAMKTAYTP